VIRSWPLTFSTEINRAGVPFTRTDVPLIEYGRSLVGAGTTPLTPRVNAVPLIIAVEPGQSTSAPVPASATAACPTNCGLGLAKEGIGPAHPISLWRYRLNSTGASWLNVRVACQGARNVNCIVSPVTTQTGATAPLLIVQTVRLPANTPAASIGPVVVNQLGWPEAL